MMNFLSIMIKILISSLILRSILRLKIDHALWMMINMIQILRTITLLNINIGLVLRNFLNQYLGGFMTQLDINILPKVLFRSDTSLDRKFRLFGLESYLFIYYFFTSLIIIISILFILTFMLAILE